MLAYCFAVNCNNSQMTPGITMHELLRYQPAVRRKWIKFIQFKWADFLAAPHHTHLCSEHFSECNFANPIEYRMSKLTRCSGTLSCAKLEHIAHYKAKNQSTVKTNFHKHMCMYTVHTHKHIQSIGQLEGSDFKKMIWKMWVVYDDLTLQGRLFWTDSAAQEKDPWSSKCVHTEGKQRMYQKKC